MIRAFFAAVVAALALSWYDALGTGKLTLFEVNYPQDTWHGKCAQMSHNFELKRVLRMPPRQLKTTEIVPNSSKFFSLFL